MTKRKKFQETFSKFYELVSEQVYTMADDVAHHLLVAAKPVTETFLAVPVPF